MNDVFLSYAREDQPRAQQLAAALEAKGWKVWWDKHITTGKTFDEVIQEALDDTRSVVVLWSEWSTKSNWVKEEAAEGARRGILVPCLIDDVRIPLGFGRIQTASLIDWKGEADHSGFQQLCAALAASIEAATARATARFATVPKPAGDSRPLSHDSTPAPAATVRPPWRRLRAPLLGALSAVVIVGAGYAAFVGRNSAGEERDIGPRETAEVIANPESGAGETADGTGETMGGTGETTAGTAQSGDRLVSISGQIFAQAVKLAGGDHAVTSRDSFSQCDLTSEGDDYVAWVKAGPTGSKCQFRLNRNVRVLPSCRIVGWKTETPEPDSFRWIATPQVGSDDPVLELRMWADPFQGRRKFKLQQVQLSVPADTPTLTAGDLTLVDAPTLADRCLEAAA